MLKIKFTLQAYYYFIFISKQLKDYFFFKIYNLRGDNLKNNYIVHSYVWLEQSERNETFYV